MGNRRSRDPEEPAPSSVVPRLADISPVFSLLLSLVGLTGARADSYATASGCLRQGGSPHVAPRGHDSPRARRLWSQLRESCLSPLPVRKAEVQLRGALGRDSSLVEAPTEGREIAAVPRLPAAAIQSSRPVSGQPLAGIGK